MTEESYNDIGQLLKRAREEQGLELEAISQTLHIRVRYLDALENGRLADLPGISYTKGYLQVYAGYVGLDKDEMLRRFEEIEAAMGRRGFFLPQVFHQEKKPSSIFIWGGLAAALLVFLAWQAVQPAKFSISLVEAYPHSALPWEIGNSACLQQSPALYPPCTMTWQAHYSLVSLQPQVKVPGAIQQTAER